MAAILKIFIALIVTSVVKDDSVHSCALRSHRTTNPPPCPSDHPDSDAIPGHPDAPASCAQPAPLRPEQRQLSDAPTNVITSNSSSGSNSIPLHHSSTAVALSSPFPEPSVTPVPSSLDFDRLLENFQRHFSSVPTPVVVTSPPAPVPSDPAKSAQCGQTEQIERLLMILLSTPGIVAVPSPTVPIATGPAESQPQTTAASDSPAPTLPPVDSAPTAAAATAAAVPTDPAAVASVSKFPPIVVVPAAPNVPQDTIAEPSSQSTPLQSILSQSTPPPPSSSPSSTSATPRST